MIQTYLFMKRTLLAGRSANAVAYLIIITFLAWLLSVWFRSVYKTALSQELFYIATSLVAFFILSYISLRRRAASFMNDLIDHTSVAIVALLAATYSNAFIHELPNVAAKQWVYTSYPLHGVLLWHIPFSLLIGWPLLCFLPIAVYYGLAPSPIAKRRV